MAAVIPIDVVEADAADRLILDEASDVIAGANVLAVESLALAIGARDAGSARVQVSFDSVGDGARASAFGFDTGEMASNIDVVLLRMPKSLGALDAIARGIAAAASPNVVVFAGARLKYMTPRMNEVLFASFERLDVSLARQKSRVLIARAPRPVAPPTPKRTRIDQLDLVIGSLGSVFAGDALDLGTRALLDQFDGLPAFDTAIDFGCGTGILAAGLKRRRPDAVVIASDVSADAVASAQETMLANGLDVGVIREAALSGQPDASADLIVLNPPFHDGGPISTNLAAPLFAAAARVLKPGAELWTVFNSSLGYRAELDRAIGPTRQIGRTAKFTVLASERRT
jgi:16S rRNA (guanine1207-N2)-methyltransferase